LQRQAAQYSLTYSVWRSWIWTTPCCGQLYTYLHKHYRCNKFYKQHFKMSESTGI